MVGLIFETSTPREFVDAAVKSAAADEELLDMTATPKSVSPKSPPSLDGESPSSMESNKWQPPTAVQFEAMRLMCTVQLLLIKVSSGSNQSQLTELNAGDWRNVRVAQLEAALTPHPCVGGMPGGCLQVSGVARSL